MSWFSPNQQNLVNKENWLIRKKINKNWLRRKKYTPQTRLENGNCGSSDAISLILPRKTQKHCQWKDRRKEPTAAKSWSFLIPLQVTLARAKMSQRFDLVPKCKLLVLMFFGVLWVARQPPLSCRRLWAGLSGLTNEQPLSGWQLEQSHPAASQPPAFGMPRAIQYPGHVASLKASRDSSPCLCADYLCQQ